VPQCLIGIEADMATHHVARELIALGQRQAAAAGLRPGRVAKPEWPPTGRMATMSNFIANDQPT